MPILDFLPNILQTKHEIGIEPKVILTETYSEPNQTSKMERFTETVNSFQMLITFEKVSSEMLHRVLDTPLSSMELHFVKSVQIRSFFWSVFSCIWTECGCRKIQTRKKFRTWTLFMHFLGQKELTLMKHDDITKL